MNKPKVSDFKLEVRSNQDVLQFHVKVREILAVEEVKSLEYLSQESFCDVLWDWSMSYDIAFNNVVKTCLTVVHDYELDL